MFWNNRHINSLATYKCDRNFNLIGNAVRICQADGTWNGTNPICKGKIVVLNNTVLRKKQL